MGRDVTMDMRSWGQREEGIVRLQVPAVLDASTLGLLLDDLQAWERGEPGGRLWLLADVRGLVSMDAEARAVVYRRASEGRNRIVAVVGRTAFHSILIRFLLFATRQPNARYFSSMERAEAWLRARLPAPSGRAVTRASVR